MSKVSLLLMATVVALVAGMKGGMELKKKIDFLVYFLTGEKLDVYYNINDTTKKPGTKWVYCMGILYDSLTVLTADSCNVEADGMHWATGVNTEIDQIHPLKSVTQGRHSLDFRVVEVKNSSVSRWGPLGGTGPSLMVTLNGIQLAKVAGEGQKGIVTTVSKPLKVGAMMMLSLDDCSDRYIKMLKAFPRTTAVFPAVLPESVFCTVQSTEAFDPNPANKRRFRRDNETASTPKSGSELKTDLDTLEGFSPINTGPVDPGLACPDSLGSPFIIDGGKVLGILVAADCDQFKVSFFQSLVDDFPTTEDYNDYLTNSPFSSTKEIKKWTPRNPMVKGETLRPVGFVTGARLEPFGGANGLAPSMLIISMGLSAYALLTNRLSSPRANIFHLLNE